MLILHLEISLSYILDICIDVMIGNWVFLKIYHFGSLTVSLSVTCIDD